jgi:hypothetical protein
VVDQRDMKMEKKCGDVANLMPPSGKDLHMLRTRLSKRVLCLGHPFTSYRTH